MCSNGVSRPRVKLGWPMVRLSGRWWWWLLATLAAASTAPPALVVSADSPVQITQCAQGGGGQQPCYSPGAVSDRTGAAVTWTNATDTLHTVMTCDLGHLYPVDPKGCPIGPPSPDAIYTSNISPGASATVVLTHPGTYLYYCTLLGYSAMHGTVTIGDAPQAAISPPAPGAAAHPSSGGQGRDAQSSPPPSGPGAGAAAAAPGPLALEPRGPLPLSVGGPPPSTAPGGAPPPGSAPPRPEVSAASDRRGSPDAHGAATPVGSTGTGNTAGLRWATASITLLALVGALGALARRRWWPADAGSPDGRPPGGG